MDLHDTITQELFDHKSVSAFIWLINQGRELEFSYHNQEFFVSRDGAKKNVSIWHNKEEQSFENIEELVLNAMVDKKKLFEVWKEIELGILF